MDAHVLIEKLFRQEHEIVFHDSFFSGRGRIAGRQVSVIGTKDRAAIGVELAHALAGAVLSAAREHPSEPILLLIDTSGQRMSHRDELLGLNGYMAHLIKCLDAARRTGSRIIGLVYDEAVSAGILATGLVADDCYALPQSQISVMNLPAMSRVTKVSLERLQDLCKTSPVFAPGVQNFVVMGAIRAIWAGDLSQHLLEALAESSTCERGRVDGERRGGRMLAHRVAERVRHA